MLIEDLYQLFSASPKISTDTRNIEKGSIFFALRGARFNGNEFARDALDKGADFAVIDDAAYNIGERTILVENSLATLQKLASYHRNQHNGKIIGLTGSNGKTTTKELLYAVLSRKYGTIATAGNLNNHIGVPLTLLRIQKDTELAIIEMGANHIGEIAALCEIAQPDFGYITNFGKAHLEGFGSEEGVVQGKSELYRYLMAHNGSIFINADDPKQRELTQSYVKKYGYSKEDPGFTIIRPHNNDAMVGLEVDGVVINSQLPGKYNFENCAAAALIGKYFNVPIPDIKAAIESYIPANNRSQLIQKNGITIILDAYNANPTSVLAALENLSHMPGDFKIAVLGDMLELGTTSIQEHEEIAKSALAADINAIYLFGGEYGKTTIDLPKFQDFESLVSELTEKIPEKAVILIKGSRGMALERLVPALWD